MSRRIEPAPTPPRHGGNASKQKPPEVAFRFFDVAGPGQPLVAEIRANGRLWLVEVRSDHDRPEVVQSVGGNTPNQLPLPPELLRPLWIELERLYKTGAPHEQIDVRLAGFRDGVLRPTLPGRQPDSYENLVVRARRVYADRRRGKKAVSATEVDACKRAAKKGLYARGEPTECGRDLLDSVDRAKDQIRNLLQAEEAVSRADLLYELSPVPWDVVDAAILDLEAGQEVARRSITCTCGNQHLGVTRGPRVTS